MCCFVILLLSNEMQMSVRRFSAIPHLRAILSLVSVRDCCCVWGIIWKELDVWDRTEIFPKLTIRL